MKQIAKLISAACGWVVREEWSRLKPQVMESYRNHIQDPAGCPSIITQELLIAGEDHRFFKHGGVDVIAIGRALWRRIVLGTIEGASTIEMQVVRVISGRYERTLRRKIREMILATLVSQAIPKDALPAIYLRVGYYGWRMNSLADACRRALIEPPEVDSMDAARLVAQLKYPRPCLPCRDRLAKIDGRARYLLRLHSRHLQDQRHVGSLMASHESA